MNRISQRLDELPVSWFGQKPEKKPGASSEVLNFEEWAKGAVPLDGSLSWLAPLDDHLRAHMAPYFRDGESRDHLTARFEKTAEEARAGGFKLPEVFLKFMRSRELRHRLPSCTACYFDAPDRLVEMADGGVLFRFLNDQQWCLLWYLYLGKDGKGAVVTGYQTFDVDSEELKAFDLDGDPPSWICALNFETFLFRFWLVNKLWFAQHHRYPELTHLEREYLKVVPEFEF
jgi:hypothetical protein